MSKMSGTVIAEKCTIYGDNNGLNNNNVWYYNSKQCLWSHHNNHHHELPLLARYMELVCLKDWVIL